MPFLFMPCLIVRFAPISWHSYYTSCKSFINAPNFRPAYLPPTFMPLLWPQCSFLFPSIRPPFRISLTCTPWQHCFFSWLCRCNAPPLPDSHLLRGRKEEGSSESPSDMRSTRANAQYRHRNVSVHP